MKYVHFYCEIITNETKKKKGVAIRNIPFVKLTFFCHIFFFIYTIFNKKKLSLTSSQHTELKF